MANKTTVSAQITENKRDEWQEASEQFGSISQLIRFAVDQYIAGDEVAQSNNQPEISPELESKVDRLLDRTDSIESGVSSINERTRLIQEEVEEVDENTRDMAGDVFDVLPSKDELLSPGTKSIEGDEVAVWTGDYIRTGKVDDIANHLEESLSSVQGALQHLKNDQHLVKTMSVEGDKRWFKDV